MATSEPNCIPDLRTQPQRAFQNPHQRGLWCWGQCNMRMKVRDLGRQSWNLPARCQEAVRGQEDVNRRPSKLAETVIGQEACQSRGSSWSHRGPRRPGYTRRCACAFTGWGLGARSEV